MPVPLSIKRGVEYSKGKKTWAEMSDAEKLEAIERYGEMTGGTIGAFAGMGAASVPGAGAGAVAGKNIANMLGRAAGLQQPQRTAGAEAMEQYRTFRNNAMFEGLGQAVPPIASAVGQGIMNKVRGALQPNAARKVLVDLADEYGIPLNIAQRSGNPILASFQAGIERLPFSSKIMREAYTKQHGKWVEGMNSLLDDLNAGRRSLDEFATEARAKFEQARKQLSAATSGAFESGASKVHPTKVSPVDSGVAAGQKLQSHKDAVEKWAKKEYAPIRARGRGINVDVSDLRDNAQSFLRQYPDTPVVNAMFDKGAVGKMKSAASLVDGGVDTARLDEIAQNFGAPNWGAIPERHIPTARMIAAKEGLRMDPVPPQMNIEQLINLRSELLHQIRGTTGDSAAMKRRALATLRKSVDDLIDGGLSALPEDAELLKKWRGTNKVYASKMQKFEKPPKSGKGNVAAGVIASTKEPEKIAGRIGSSPTLSSEAQVALSDSAISDIAKPSGPPALPMMRRSLLDTAAKEATVGAETGAPRISPSLLQSKLMGDYPEGLIGQPLPFELTPPRPMSTSPVTHGAAPPDPRFQLLPDLAQREQRLYGSKVAKAVDAGGSNNILNAAFPKANAPASRQSLALMEEVGYGPQSRRAFGDYLLDASKSESRALDDKRFVNPRIMDRFFEDYRETVPAVLGQNVTDRMKQMTELGRAITLDEVFNTSGTAKALEAVQTAKGAKGAITGGLGEALKYGADTILYPLMFAKGFSSPSLAKSLTLPPRPISVSLGGPSTGGVARALGLQPPPPPQSQSQQQPSASSSQPQYGVWDPDAEDSKPATAKQYQVWDPDAQ